MKKIYEEPEIQIRNYVLPVSDVVMTSTLTDGDNYGGDGDGSGCLLYTSPSPRDRG